MHSIEPGFDDLLMAMFALTLVALSVTRAVLRRYKEGHP
jgi:hypothetical protein